MYYVYEWYIVDNGEIFYVGKGTKNRYKVTYGRNKLFQEMINNNNCSSRIIKYFDNEKEAYVFEAERIDYLKSMGMCTCNLYSGGAGGTSEYWSDRLRKEYSEKNIMKAPEQRKRMSEHNPMRNKEISMKVGKTKMRPVIINDTEYESVKSAALAYNTTTDVVINWCKKGVNSKMETCRYKDSEQVEFNNTRYNLGGCRTVVYHNKYYESAKDFAIDIGISDSTAYSWLKRGFNPDGEEVRYVDDTENHIYENRHIVRNKNRSKKVIVNGMLYNSCTEASDILNIPKSTLYSYLNNNRFNPNYICAYDNQQPSQTNITLRSLEGSTTNS